MKDGISSLELSYLVKEIRSIVHSRIDKIYSNDNKDLFIQLYKAELGKPILRAHVPKYTYMTTYKPNFAYPSNFVMRLRKMVKNGMIRAVSKIENERIMKIKIEKKENMDLVVRTSIFHLYFEFFLKGNIVLTDESDRIISAAENQVWADRKIRIGEKYMVPEKHVSPLRPSLDKELVRYIAEDMGYGGEIAEEVCELSSIDKHRKELAEWEMKTVKDSLESLTDMEKNTKGHVYGSGDSRRIYPFPMKTRERYKEHTMHDSFNAAIDSVMSSEMAENVRTSMDKEKQKTLKKQERIIDAQKKQLEKNKKIIEENTAKGDLIYSNYSEIQEIFEQLKEARKTMDWSEIKEKIKNKKIISIDEKSGKIVLDL